PHHRPLLRAGRPARTGCVDHRRHDPLADPGKISRARHAGGLRLATSRTDAAPGVRPLLRRGHGHVRNALSFAFDRPRGALGRRLQIRRGTAAPRETAAGSLGSLSPKGARECTEIVAPPSILTLNLL